MLHAWFQEGTVDSAKTTETGAGHVAVHVADVAWFWAWLGLVGGIPRGLHDLILFCSAAASFI